MCTCRVHVQGDVGNKDGFIGQLFCIFEIIFLAHLRRRLIGELIVYEGIRRPSVCQHFQTTSPLKREADSFHISHIASIGRGKEKVCFLFQSDKNSGCYGNL